MFFPCFITELSVSLHSQSKVGDIDFKKRVVYDFEWDLKMFEWWFLEDVSFIVCLLWLRCCFVRRAWVTFACKGFQNLLTAFQYPFSPMQNNKKITSTKKNQKTRIEPKLHYRKPGTWSFSKTKTLITAVFPISNIAILAIWILA